MPRYFFDFIDDRQTTDDVGIECPDVDRMRYEAKRLLAEIALDEIPPDGEARTYHVHVRDRAGHVVYFASLEFKGQTT